MIFHVLTLFPGMIMAAADHSILRRAREKSLISIHCVNIRDHAVNDYGQTDDAPYGGGPGMILQAPPVYDAFASIKPRIKDNPPRVVYLTPQGQIFNQKKAYELAGEQELVLLCGHYEGVDERVVEEIVTDEISVGDYILTGGELAALAVIDAVTRLIPGVLNKAESLGDESFTHNLLEYPQYTRPPVFRGREVPGVLLSGHHGQIAKWRAEQSLKRTGERRPDLLEKN